MDISCMHTHCNEHTCAGADPGFFKGGLKAMIICINYIISYCNYSHYYFKRSALQPTETYTCMNLLAAVPAAQQLYS